MLFISIIFLIAFLILYNLVIYQKMDSLSNNCYGYFIKILIVFLKVLKYLFNFLFGDNHRVAKLVVLRTFSKFQIIFLNYDIILMLISY